jgi:hypothetical protein
MCVCVCRISTSRSHSQSTDIDEKIWDVAALKAVLWIRKNFRKNLCRIRNRIRIWNQLKSSTVSLSEKIIPHPQHCSKVWEEVRNHIRLLADFLVKPHSRIFELLYFYTNVQEYSRREILRDLVEMCRGVQHPLRGLFLRSFPVLNVRFIDTHLSSLLLCPRYG